LLLASQPVALLMLLSGLSVRLVICPYVLTETAAGNYQCRCYGLRCRTFTQTYHDATTPLVCAPLLYRAAAAAIALLLPQLLPALLLLLLLKLLLLLLLSRYYCC
jgi:hypothetical protein